MEEDIIAENVVMFLNVQHATFLFFTTKKKRCFIVIIANTKLEYMTLVHIADQRIFQHQVMA